MSTQNRFGHTLEKLDAEPPSTKTAMSPSFPKLKQPWPQERRGSKSGNALPTMGSTSLSKRSQSPSTGPKESADIRTAKGKPRIPQRVCWGNGGMAWRVNRTVIPLIVESVRVFDWVLRLWKMGQAVIPG
jgi:hypothetical protein